MSAFDPKRTWRRQRKYPAEAGCVIEVLAATVLQRRRSFLQGNASLPELAGDEMPVGAGQRSTPYSLTFPPDSASLGLSADLIQA